MQQRFQESSKTTTPRFDNETVREVLARASEIESQQKDEKLTAAQIEALGQELGMSPDAVRQALQEKVGVSATNHIVPANPTLQTITRQDIKTASKTSAIYSVISFVLIVLANIISGKADIELSASLALLVTLAYFVLGPFVLPFYYGWKRRDARQGALLGATLVPMYLVSVVAGVTVSRWFAHNGQYAEVGVFVVLALFGIPFGLLGGALGRWFHNRKIAQGR